MEPTSTEQESCPVCGTVRTLDRVQCRCGYSFASGFVEPLEVAETAPPRKTHWLSSTRSPEGAAAERVSGSVFVGLMLGFICGCLGLLFAYGFAVPAETKRGVWIGFVVQFVLGVLLEIRYGSY